MPSDLNLSEILVKGNSHRADLLKAEVQKLTKDLRDRWSQASRLPTIPSAVAASLDTLCKASFWGPSCAPILCRQPSTLMFARLSRDAPKLSTALSTVSVDNQVPTINRMLIHPLPRCRPSSFKFMSATRGRSTRQLYLRALRPVVTALRQSRVICRHVVRDRHCTW